MEKIAIPTINGEICAHFGHCEKFAILEVKDGKILKKDYVDPPFHQPGSHPRFLAQQGANVIICGGMGTRALDLFKQNGIEVVLGVTSGKPEEIVQSYLQNNLQSSANLCDH